MRLLSPRTKNNAGDERDFFTLTIDRVKSKLERLHFGKRKPGQVHVSSDSSSPASSPLPTPSPMSSLEFTSTPPAPKLALMDLPNELLMCIGERVGTHLKDLLPLLKTNRRFASLMPDVLAQRALGYEHLAKEEGKPRCSDPSRINNCHRCPILVWAISHKQDKLVELLLKQERKARLHVDDGYGGITALFAAVLMGNIGLVKRLLDIGANPNARSKLFGKYGLQPLHCALILHQNDMARLLLYKGASYTSPIRQRSALFVAVRAGNFEMVEFLMQAKLSVTVKDDTGMSALDYARFYNQRRIFEYLRTFTDSDEDYTSSLLPRRAQYDLVAVESIALSQYGSCSICRRVGTGGTKEMLSGEAQDQLCTSAQTESTESTEFTKKIATDFVDLVFGWPVLNRLSIVQARERETYGFSPKAKDDKADPHPRTATKHKMPRIMHDTSKRRRKSGLASRRQSAGPFVFSASPTGV